MGCCNKAPPPSGVGRAWGRPAPMSSVFKGLKWGRSFTRWSWNVKPQRLLTVTICKTSIPMGYYPVAWSHLHNQGAKWKLAVTNLSDVLGWSFCPQQSTTHVVWLTVVHSNVFWSMVDLRRCALGVSIANTWVRFSSYSKGDIRRSQPVWSPQNFWQLPYLGYNHSTQIKFVQMYFIVQDNIVTFSDKNT